MTPSVISNWRTDGSSRRDTEICKERTEYSRCWFRKQRVDSGGTVQTSRTEHEQRGHRADCRGRLWTAEAWSEHSRKSLIIVGKEESNGNGKRSESGQDDRSWQNEKRRRGDTRENSDKSGKAKRAERPTWAFMWRLTRATRLIRLKKPRRQQRPTLPIREGNNKSGKISKSIIVETKNSDKIEKIDKSKKEEKEDVVDKIEKIEKSRTSETSKKSKKSLRGKG